MSRPIPGETAPPTWWRRFVAALPMRTALVAVAVVWLLGCAWSFEEQSAFAASKGFAFPHLLPLVIDGFAVAMAGVSWAASLDARPAVPARLATVIAVAGSAASNGTWAWQRTAHTGHDVVTVILGATVPVAANLAFEVLLAELRRQVHRRRGLPAPVAVPYPRLIRIVLAPISTLRDWRHLVLDLTELTTQLAPATAHQASPAPAAPSPVTAPPPARTAPAPLTASTHSGPAPAAAVAEPMSGIASDAGAGGPAHLSLLPVAPTPTRRSSGTDPSAPDTPASAETPARLRRVLEVREQLLAQGTPVTGVNIAAELGCSARTGRRLLLAASTDTSTDTTETGAETAAAV